MKITISIDRGQLKGLPDQLNRKVQRCAAIALTRSAYTAKSEFGGVAKQTFRGTTRFTESAARVKPAKANELVATLSAAPRQDSYLGVQSKGGLRTAKAYERALTMAGLLPRGYVTVPGWRAPLDANGNIPRSFLVAMLRQLTDSGYGGASKGDAAKQARAYRKHGGLMVVPVGQLIGRGNRFLQPGIYRVKQTAQGWDLDPLLIFVRQAYYQPLLDWPAAVKATVNQHFPAEFAKAFNT